MRNLYTTKRVCKLTGITGRQLRYLVIQGVIKPAMNEGKGYGTRRAYDFDNLVQIEVAKQLRRYSIKPQVIAEAVEQINSETVGPPTHNLTLFTDGKRHHTINARLVVPTAVIMRMRRGVPYFGIAIDKILETLEERINGN